MVIKVKVYESENVHELILDKSIKTIGRSSSCDIKLTDDHVSGKHLAFKKTEQGKVVVKDLGSTNGTFLNQSSISESLLRINDVLTIGPNIKISIDSGSLSSFERSSIEINEKPVIGITNTQESAQDATTVMKINRKKPINQSAEPANDADKEVNSAGPVKVGKNITEMELEESSGMTRMIKIDRSPKVEAKESAKIKKRVRTKPSPVKKEEGLLDKILKLFKA